jgi:hypothetical protein
MKAIGQRIPGHILMDAAHTHAALLLSELPPASSGAESPYLRYAYLLRETEASIFPAFILDDWGSEIRGLELYDWVAQFGDRFPRAEMFGFDLSGGERQYFLRELELHVRMRCYAYRAKEDPLSEGVLVRAILLPDSSVASPQRLRKRPLAIPQPLRSVNAKWWLVKPPLTDLALFFD